MAEYLDLLPEDVTIGEVFSDVHTKAHDLAVSIPVFDKRRKAPEVGEVYTHLEEWNHPSFCMPAERRYVRVSMEDGFAPYFYEVVSLGEQDGEQKRILPVHVSVYEGATTAATLAQRSPKKPVEVATGFLFRFDYKLKPSEDGRHFSTTEVSKLRSRDYKRLKYVTSVILGTMAAVDFYVRANDEQTVAAEAD